MDEFKDFFYCFQPKICVKTKRITTYEALLRFKDKIGILTPVEMINRINDEPDLALSFLDLLYKQVSSTGLDDRITLSINISPKVIEQSCDALIDKLSRFTRFSLEIEVIESNAINDFYLYNCNVQKLKNDLPNIRIVLDDFGKLYGSFERLIKARSIDGIKIDKDIFRYFTLNYCDIDKYKKWLELIKMFDIDITVEGVEDKTDFAIAVELGADFLQGYYIGNPRCFI